MITACDDLRIQPCLLLITVLWYVFFLHLDEGCSFQRWNATRHYTCVSGSSGKWHKNYQNWSNTAFCRFSISTQVFLLLQEMLLVMTIFSYYDDPHTSSLHLWPRHQYCMVCNQSLAEYRLVDD